MELGHPSDLTLAVLVGLITWRSAGGVARACGRSFPAGIGLVRFTGKFTTNTTRFRGRDYNFPRQRRLPKQHVFGTWRPRQSNY